MVKKIGVHRQPYKYKNALIWLSEVEGRQFPNGGNSRRSRPAAFSNFRTFCVSFGVLPAYRSHMMIRTFN
jgi:hypothetical protein